MARKRKYIDRNLLKSLCHCQLTDEEIATALRVDRSTLFRRYATAIKAWKAEGVSSMRRRLYTTAMEDVPITNKEGNVIGYQPKSGATTAMIFFLKNFAGMKDNQDEKPPLNTGDLAVPNEFRKTDKSDDQTARVH